jgi:creatinine amidohydrolase
MSAKVTLWQGLRRGDVGRLASSPPPVIVPLGSIEQHGDHLPLDTDSYTAQAVALEVADRASFPVLVAPTIWWGVSGYWMRFPGTIAIAPATLETLLVDISTSIAAHGFRRILLLNGHAGNAGALHGTCVRVAAMGVRIAGLNYWALAQTELERLSVSDGGRIGHAGEIETALQLHLRPDHVGTLPPASAATGLPRSILPGPFGDVAVMAPDPSAESPTGVYGNPDTATAEVGAAAFAAVVDGIIAFLDAFRIVPLPDAGSTR